MCVCVCVCVYARTRARACVCERDSLVHKINIYSDCLLHKKKIYF